MSYSRSTLLLQKKKGDLPLITKKLGTVRYLCTPCNTPALYPYFTGQMFIKIILKTEKIGNFV